MIVQCINRYLTLTSSTPTLYHNPNEPPTLASSTTPNPNRGQMLAMADFRGSGQKRNEKRETGKTEAGKLRATFLMLVSVSHKTLAFSAFPFCHYRGQMSGAGGGKCAVSASSVGHHAGAERRRRRQWLSAINVAASPRRCRKVGRSIKIDSVAAADICTPRSVTIQPTDAGPAGSPGQRRSTVAGKRPHRASIINGGGRGMRHNRRPRARREVMSVSPDPPIVSSSRRLPARPLHAGLTLL